jgi:hypothetical protein
MPELTGLPGAELVRQGLADLDSGIETVPALLVTMARSRLRRLGIPVPTRDLPDAELRLYRALCQEDPAAAYGRYNALLRRLVSLARALEREQGKGLRRRARGEPP